MTKLAPNEARDTFTKMLIKRNGRCLWQQEMKRPDGEPHSMLEGWIVGRWLLIIQAWPDVGIEVYTNQDVPDDWPEIAKWLDRPCGVHFTSKHGEPAICILDAHHGGFHAGTDGGAPEIP